MKPTRALGFLLLTLLVLAPVSAPPRSPAQTNSIPNIKEIGKALANPKTHDDDKSATWIPAMSKAVFGTDPKGKIDLEEYTKNLTALKELGAFDGEEGMERLLFLQIAFESRFGDEIELSHRAWRWGREGTILGGTALGIAGAWFYHKSKIRSFSLVASALFAKAGIATGYGASRLAYDESRANGVPPSPMEVVGLDFERPEDMRWNRGESLAGNLTEGAMFGLLYPAGAAASAVTTNWVRRRFTKKKTCADASASIFHSYAVRTKAFKSISGFKNHSAEWLRNLGPVGTVGGLGAYLSVQFAVDEYSDRLSNRELRAKLKESEALIERYRKEDRREALIAEAYVYREMIEYYFEALMVDRIQQSLKQVVDAVPGRKVDLNDGELVLTSLAKSYSKPEWDRFVARIEGYQLAREEHGDLLMPGLYREVLLDGLPQDPGNILLYGAAILHKHDLAAEFERIYERISFIFHYHKALSGDLSEETEAAMGETLKDTQ